MGFFYNAIHNIVMYLSISVNIKILFLQTVREKSFKYCKFHENHGSLIPPILSLYYSTFSLILFEQ